MTKVKATHKRPATISAIVRASRPVLAKVRRKQAKMVSPMFAEMYAQKENGKP